jgi:hypothetical protein
VANTTRWRVGGVGRRARAVGVLAALPAATRRIVAQSRQLLTGSPRPPGDAQSAAPLPANTTGSNTAGCQ